MNFKPTKFDKPGDKEWFAKQFIKFAKSDFQRRHFTKKFYTRLSMTFGFIAHYDQEGFWQEYFEDENSKKEFIKQCLIWPCYGDPEYTYSDVEKYLKQWIRTGVE